MIRTNIHLISFIKKKMCCEAMPQLPLLLSAIFFFLLFPFGIFFQEMTLFSLRC